MRNVLFSLCAVLVTATLSFGQSFPDSLYTSTELQADPEICNPSSSLYDPAACDFYHLNNPATPSNWYDDWYFRHNVNRPIWPGLVPTLNLIRGVQGPGQLPDYSYNSIHLVSISQEVILDGSSNYVRTDAHYTWSIPPYYQTTPCINNTTYVVTKVCPEITYISKAWYSDGDSTSPILLSFSCNGGAIAAGPGNGVNVSSGNFKPTLGWAMYPPVAPSGIPCAMVGMTAPCGSTDLSALTDYISSATECIHTYFVKEAVALNTHSIYASCPTPATFQFTGGPLVSKLVGSGVGEIRQAIHSVYGLINNSQGIWPLTSANNPHGGPGDTFYDNRIIQYKRDLVSCLTPATHIFYDATYDERVNVRCQADLNCDGVIDGDDYTIFTSSYSTADVASDHAADIVGAGPDSNWPDGTIDGDDYIAFMNAYTSGCDGY